MKTPFSPIRLALFFASLAAAMLLPGALAQDAAAETPEAPRLRFGAKADLVAFRIARSGSFYLSPWAAWNQNKFSLVVAHLDVMKDHLTDGFARDEIDLVGVKAERYFRPDLRGWSLGAQLHYSDSKVVTEENRQEGHLRYAILGAAVGYTWVFFDHLTVKPNVNLLVPLRDRHVSIGTDKESIAPWGLEVGLAAGVSF